MKTIKQEQKCNKQQKKKKKNDQKRIKTKKLRIRKRKPLLAIIFLKNNVATRAVRVANTKTTQKCCNTKRSGKHTNKNE